MTLYNQNQDVLPASDIKPIIDNSVIDGEFEFNNCDDIHIGPKYENSNNIIINNTISVSSEVLENNIKDIIKEEIQIPNCDQTIDKDNAFLCKISRKYLAAIVLCLMVVLATTVLLILNKERETDPPTKPVIPGPSQGSDDYPLELRFVTRESWGAAQPLTKKINNTLPVKQVIFIHTAGSSCNKYTLCSESVRNIQELQMDDDHKFGDIGYNFLLGGDGYIYVGVGWDYVGVHTKGHNNGTLGVAFIGDYRTDELNDKMIESAKNLLQFGVKIKKLSEDYQFFGHCQVHSGFPYSPGKNVLKVITKWDHWNDTQYSNCKG